MGGKLVLCVIYLEVDWHVIGSEKEIADIAKWVLFVLL
jgi:hypothetical protein